MSEYAIDVRKNGIGPKRLQSLGNFLETISDDIEHFYYKEAWRGLNIPEELVAHSNTTKIRYFFDKKEVQGAKYLFVVTMTEEHSTPVTATSSTPIALCRLAYLPANTILGQC